MSSYQRTARIKSAPTPPDVRIADCSFGVRGFCARKISGFLLFPSVPGSPDFIIKKQSSSENLIGSQGRFFPLRVLCQVFVPPLAALYQNHLLVIKRRGLGGGAGPGGRGVQRLGSPSPAAPS